MPKSWVSIHALLVECDTTVNQTGVGLFGFQSTHSLWSATLIDKCLGKFEQFQSTHSLWSATGSYCRNSCFVVVSIHALLVECDFKSAYRASDGETFQSTHSLWSATGSEPQQADNQGVSIHALLVECDGEVRGDRHRLSEFQSTHSLWSATAPDLIHCYSTEQIILCANLPKKTVIARLLFLSIYLSIFYSQCITPIADLPGNSCELEVGAQAMFNSL